jgi:hypothetical protein
MTTARLLVRSLNTGCEWKQCLYYLETLYQNYISGLTVSGDWHSWWFGNPGYFTLQGTGFDLD